MADGSREEEWELGAETLAVAALKDHIWSASLIRKPAGPRAHRWLETLTAGVLLCFSIATPE